MVIQSGIKIQVEAVDTNRYCCFGLNTSGSQQNYLHLNYKMNFCSTVERLAFQALALSCYFLIMPRASFPASHAVGLYATAISNTANQVGEGSMNRFMIPPTKKKSPISNANFIL